MKRSLKRCLLLLLAACLLLTAGCAKKDAASVPEGAGSAEELDELSIAPSVTVYGAEALDFPQKLWFDQNTASIRGKTYLVGSFLENCTLYRMDPDGSGAEALASCTDGSQQWYSFCTMGDAILIYDSMGQKLLRFSAEGEALPSVTLPEGVSVTSLSAEGESLYVLGNGALYSLSLGVGGQAELNYKLNVSGAASLGRDGSGRLYVAWEKEGVQVISTVDEANRTWGETRTLDSSCAIIGGGEEWELYLNINNALYGYNFSSETMQKLLNFSDLGLAGNGAVAEAGDGRLLYTGSNGSEASFPYLLSPVESTGEAVTLTLATVGEIYDLDVIRQAVQDWNRANPNCKVEIRDYSAFGDSAELRLAADISAGNAPDLYNFREDLDGAALDPDVYTRRGLLEDLVPYLDADPELSRSDFLSGPLSALETDGGLYQMAPGFALLTATAPADAVGGPENWTYAGLEDLATRSGSYQSLFSLRESRSGWLREMVCASADKLIDWESGSCAFDSAYFISLLKLAAQLPESYVHTQDDGEEPPCLLSLMRFDALWPAAWLPETYGEGNVAYVGLPEVGNVAVPSLSLGMSAFSAHKEECWQFLRTFLKKDSPYVTSLSLRRDRIEQEMQKELEEARERDPQTYDLKKSGMEALISQLESANRLYRRDGQIWSIVSEEAGKFFAGNSTAEEAARAVQSRAGIYLAEQAA